jgi:hypothetical protein
MTGTIRSSSSSRCRPISRSRSDQTRRAARPPPPSGRARCALNRAVRLLHEPVQDPVERMVIGIQQVEPPLDPCILLPQKREVMVILDLVMPVQAGSRTARHSARSPWAKPCASRSPSRNASVSRPMCAISCRNIMCRSSQKLTSPWKSGCACQLSRGCVDSRTRKASGRPARCSRSQCGHDPSLTGPEAAFNPLMPPDAPSHAPRPASPAADAPGTARGPSSEYSPTQRWQATPSSNSGRARSSGDSGRRHARHSETAIRAKAMAHRHPLVENETAALPQALISGTSSRYFRMPPCR